MLYKFNFMYITHAMEYRRRDRIWCSSSSLFSFTFLCIYINYMRLNLWKNGDVQLLNGIRFKSTLNRIWKKLIFPLGEYMNWTNENHEPELSLHIWCRSCLFAPQLSSISLFNITDSRPRPGTLFFFLFIFVLQSFFLSFFLLYSCTITIIIIVVVVVLSDFDNIICLCSALFDAKKRNRLTLYKYMVISFSCSFVRRLFIGIGCVNLEIYDIFIVGSILCVFHFSSVRQCANRLIRDRDDGDMNMIGNERKVIYIVDSTCEWLW